MIAYILTVGFMYTITANSELNSLPHLKVNNHKSTQALFSAMCPLKPKHFHSGQYQQHTAEPIYL